MGIKEDKIEVEKKINDALIEFNKKTDLTVEEVNFSTEPKAGYTETVDYRVKIKASIK